MSSILDIARSGVLSYRTALSVTAENVANANTEGYVRRDVTMAVLPGARMTPSSGGTLGQGVSVQDVRRAFDSLTADRLRAGESALAAADTRVTLGEGIENTFLPGADGIAAAMDEFFGSLNSLASQPADAGLRRVVLQMGSAVATAFSDAASSLAAVREDAVTSAGLAAQKATGILKQIEAVNSQMMGISSSVGAVNPLHDMRDRLLTELAQTVEVNVTLDEPGRAMVRLGPGPGGLTLVEIGSSASMQLSGTKPISVQVARADSRVDTVVLTGGELGGLAGGLAALDAAIGDLDALARRFADGLNQAHSAGLDLNGAAGGDLFQMSGIDVIRSGFNKGTYGVSLSGTALAQDVSVTYSSASGLWTARDTAGTVLSSGIGRVDLGGMSVAIEGTAADGDSFQLSPRSGRAIDLRFVLSDPRALAAAAATITAPMPGNTGTAIARIDPVTRPLTGLSDISTLLAADAANAVSLISPGVVGVIPAGTESVSLASLSRQSSADWMVGDADISAGGSLNLVADGVTHDFAFGPGMTSAGLAAALNDGTLVSGTGQTLSALGISAGGIDGQFSLARASGDFTSGVLNIGGTSRTALVTPSNATPSKIQVFTRDGRQVAGTPLTAAEAASLMTVANGFFETASLRTDWMNGASGAAYRGMTVERSVAPGAESLVLTVPDPAAGPLSLSSPAGSATLDVASGTSALRLSQAIAGVIPGLAASAETAVSLSDIPDGRVAFSLAGANTASIRIEADVAGADLSALARAINNAASATGVNAELSSTGDRLLLRQEEGHDIRVTAFHHGLGGSMTVTPSDQEGGVRGGSDILGTLTGKTDVRVSGQVTLIGATSFTAKIGTNVLASTSDALAGGMATRETTAAGDVQTWAFKVDAGFDGPGISDDGMTVVAPGLVHEMQINGVTTRAQGATSAAAVADAIVADLRAQAPQAALVGASLAALPPDGTATAVTLDGQTYVLRMDAGSVAVEGPETGRLSAAFDASNRLVLSVFGGSPSGIGVNPAPGASGADAFGLGSGAVASITGKAFDPTTLPAGGAILSVEVDGTRHDLLVEDASGTPAVTVPPDFPGSVAVLADGRLELSLASNAGQMRILPGAEELGFVVAGVEATRSAGELRLQSVTGTPPAVALNVRATAGERLTLGNLPPEDLIVVLGGAGSALRLAGTVEASFTPPLSRATHVAVDDAATGRISLIDTETGHSIASGFLNATGEATLGNFHIALSGTPATGDRFSVAANESPSGDSRALQRLIALADADPTKGEGGFARILAELTTDVGAQLKAGRQKQDAVQAIHDTLSRRMAEAGAVDLDAEAAKLIELQQAYQASAQTLSIAQQMFDTILNAM